MQGLIGCRLPFKNIGDYCFSTLLTRPSQSIIVAMSHPLLFIITAFLSLYLEYYRFLFLFSILYNLIASSSSLIASLLMFYTNYKIYKPVDDFPRNRKGMLYKTYKVYKIN